MADTLELQIVTPDKLLVHERVEGVQIPGKSGELGVLPGHAPLITTLTIGEISYRQGANTHYLVGRLGLRRGSAGQGDDPCRHRGARRRD